MKSLVVFYSYEGNTRALAEAMADEIGADVLEVKPTNEIKSKGFGKFVWGGRRVVLNIMPDLVPYDIDAADYDLILVGTPVWAFTMAPPCKAYLTRTALTGQDVALFCTHEGRDGKTLPNMRKLAAGANVVGERDFVRVMADVPAAQEQARAWAREIVGAAGQPSS